MKKTINYKKIGGVDVGGMYCETLLAFRDDDTDNPIPTIRFSNGVFRQDVSFLYSETDIRNLGFSLITLNAEIDHKISENKEISKESVKGLSKSNCRTIFETYISTSSSLSVELAYATETGSLYPSITFSTANNPWLRTTIVFYNWSNIEEFGHLLIELDNEIKRINGTSDGEGVI